MTSNTLASIYAITISSEKYLIITSQNIELSGNVIIKDGLISNGLLTTNSLIPNVTNSASLGSTSNSWSNAYINDVSVTNIELSGNILPLNANSSTLGSSLKPWSNSYIRDASITNIELSGNITPLNANRSALGSALKHWSNAYISDISATNIELSGNMLPLNANRSALGSSQKPWSNAYLRDASISAIELSGNIIPLNGNKSSLGSSLKPWSNAYISDVSASAIELSGNIVPLNANRSILGSALKPWNNAYISDLSVSAIELSGNIVPLNANRSTLGSGLKPWSNAYISDVSVTNIELSGNIVPLNANRSTLGSSVKPWSNAYIIDASITNIDVSGKLNVAGATKLVNTLEVSGNVTFGGSNLYVPSSFTIDPMGHGDNTGTVVINGNLVVQGVTTTINSSVVDISDKILVLASNASNAIQADGAGFEISGAKVNFLYNNSSASFRSSIGISISGNMVPLTSTSSLGSSLIPWSNAYINDVSVSAIELSGNIIPLNANRSTLGSSVKPWSNSYIRDVSATNIDLSGNIVPLNANRSTLGSNVKPWSNAYISDASATNIELSGNMFPLNANRSTLGTGLKPWSNAYISDVSASAIELSGNMLPLNANRSTLGSALKPWSNAYISDVSITNIELSGNIIPLNANRSTLGSGLKPWSNSYIIDASITNIELSGNMFPLNANRSALGTGLKPWNNAYLRDVSVTAIELSGNIVPLNANSSTLGSNIKPWSNAYIRDVSITNIELSGNILALNTNSSILGSSLKRLNNVFVNDLSVNTINGTAYSAGGGGGTVDISSVSSNIIPSLTNTYSLGSTTRNWSNAYIRDMSLSNRAYQEISGDISWNAVNGYYGLAKDAYPGLNPLSSGVKAFTNITTRNKFVWPIASCCWSPQLLRFVGAGYLRATWSNDGINWTENFIANQDSRLNHNWNSICWSPELMLFVAVGDGRTMRSSNGINWIFTSEFTTASWRSVCWSAQLGLFVATGASGTNNRVITSPNGIDWTRQTGIPDNNWNNVCWSAELGIFIAASDGGTNVFMSSTNGINWTALGIPPNAVGIRGICWSKELGLFVAVSGNTSMISNNGLTWNSYSMNWSGNAWSICWIPEFKLFVVTNDIFLSLNTSPNGINWTPITVNGTYKSMRNVTWSPELGIFVSLSTGAGDGAIHTVLVSSLKGRPPTSYNVFDSSFNSIAETGTWTFQNMYVATMTAGGAPVNSDDRLKHNEVAINNGLAVIDQLTPKFYQKTFDMLDADYNGDLSNHAWIYEAGLIAQEVLQIPDLSFAVSGGDYYEKIYILKSQINDPSANYDISSNYESSFNYELSSNYDISYNLIRQAYSLNYNSIYVYVVAAIKELHQKVKAQEVSILNRQTIINSCNARIEELEKSNQV